MRSRKVGLLLMVLVAALALGGGGRAQAAIAALATNDLPLTPDQLIYTGAPVVFQVDIDGKGAIQLLGGALDAAAEVAQQQVGLLAGLGQGPSSDSAAMQAVPVIAAGLIQPAKEALKSITRVTVVIMKPIDQAQAEQMLNYYSGLMSKRGWSTLITVRAGQGQPGLSALVAPGGKGLFGVVQPDKNQVVVALLAADKPVGDLLAQIIRAAGPVLERIPLPLLAGGRTVAPPPPPPAPEPSAKG